jgi:eukaryotic-like serine/threonine-protein kinase
MDSVDRAEQGPGPGGTRPLLSRAAESIAATSGVAATVVDVVHDRALKHYGEGLRQFLAIRLGCLEQAGAAMGELRAVATARGAGVLAGPPGVRANLYREARHIAQRRLQASAGASPGGLPWRAPRRVAAQVVDRMRAALSAADAEILELRHARELPVEEVAHVLDLPVQDARDRLAAAEAKARALAERAASGVPVAHILIETFALEPPASDDGNALSRRPEPLEPGAVIGGRYAVERRVGSGAFGDVYRANDTEVPGHVVALKLLHQPSQSETAREQALRELHLIASVFHPSVVQFKDNGWFEDRLWFVMPWYEGETLQNRMTRAPLARAEARRIFEPLARALDTMHAAGIRHQDVKPDNIFLARIRGFGRDGDDEILPILIDLGVAAKEAEMVVAGTPNYFAPEVAAQFASVPNRGSIGAASDVFALALSLRNALEPSTQEDVPAGAVETFIHRRATEPPPMPESRELRFLVPAFQRWMSLEPAERPTADEFADELAVLTRPEVRRRRRATILRWVIPALVTIGVVFAGVVHMLNQRAEHEKMEADRAKSMASGLREDLEMSLEQRRELERDVAVVRERYEKGQLTRTQFARELARTEAELGVTRRRLAGTQEARAELEEQLEQTNTELFDAQRDLEELRTDLAEARSALAASADQVAAMRDELAEASRRADRFEGEVASLEGALERTQAEADRARNRAREREQRAAALEADMTRARTRAAADVARLERRIAELEARGGSSPEPPEDDEE